MRKLLKAGLSGGIVFYPICYFIFNLNYSQSAVVSVLMGILTIMISHYKKSNK